ncbi:hypothetical protein GWI33_023186 [Rhynchophorus ferrugineus]|uniref:Uncharacterized protein n=1 Tax=Rhynchophorus ferrugineus TaxID=354439 RepID=A0A834ITN4_RHYFE|nr:hypothetical protein GWI33_023186 [Rhynchophorus ferrugineus]
MDISSSSSRCFDDDTYNIDTAQIYHRKMSEDEELILLVGMSPPIFIILLKCKLLTKSALNNSSNRLGLNKKKKQLPFVLQIKITIFKMLAPVR